MDQLIKTFHTKHSHLNRAVRRGEWIARWLFHRALWHKEKRRLKLQQKMKFTTLSHYLALWSLDLGSVGFNLVFIPVHTQQRGRKIHSVSICNTLTPEYNKVQNKIKTQNLKDQNNFNSPQVLAPANNQTQMEKGYRWKQPTYHQCRKGKGIFSSFSFFFFPPSPLSARLYVWPGELFTPAISDTQAPAQDKGKVTSSASSLHQAILSSKSDIYFEAAMAWLSSFPSH